MKSNNISNEDTIKEDVVERDEIKIKRPRKYIITVTNLALREGPGTDYERIGIAPSGIVRISEIENGFGKLVDTDGWISMEYTRKAD